MSGHSYSLSSSDSSSSTEQQSDNPSLASSNSEASSVMARAQAISELEGWLDIQYERVFTSALASREQDAARVLAFLEDAWFQFQETGRLPALQSMPSASTAEPQSRLALPLELTGRTRPLIDLAENSSLSGPRIDWNSRLGIPEYRTQSDNFAAPEATCNVTTLAMVLERLGYSRSDVVDAMEARFGISSSTAEEKSQVWEQKALSYIDSVMTDTRAYRRIRGVTAVSREDRASLAGEFQDQAQFEDLLDLLLKDMGISRYGVISEPTRLLEELSGDDAGNTEIIWNSRWDSLSEKIRNCLENGGASALSFRHKGTRSRGTHIVAILGVESDGLRIDDPYGDVRSDYNPRAWDDAYWSKNENGNLVAARDELKNQPGQFTDWGVDWMSDLPSSEEKGKETFLSSEQVTRSFNYVQLFHRPNSSAE